MQPIKDFLIIAIAEMQNKLNIDYVLKDEDFKMQNLKKRYTELAELTDIFLK